MSQQSLPPTERPDLYADTAQVSVGPFGVLLTLSVTDAEGTPHHTGNVRVSPQLAYVIARILLKGLASAGEDGLGYSVPKEVLAQIGLSEGDPS